MNYPPKRAFRPALTRLALRFYDEALELGGDEHEAAMLASATFMAALDRLRVHDLERRGQREQAASKPGS
jgi:hypothetical protein